MTSARALRFREQVEIQCFLEYTVYIKNNTFFQEEAYETDPGPAGGSVGFDGAPCAPLRCGDHVYRGGHGKGIESERALFAKRVKRIYRSFKQQRKDVRS